MRVVVLACVAVGAFYVWWSGHALPPVVASHFGADGVPDGYMPRALYVGVMAGVVAIVPGALALGARGLLGRSAASINLPNRDHWLAPARIDATLRTLVARLQVFACLLAGLLCFVHHEVVVANARTPPILDSRTLFVAIGVFVVVTIAWVATLYGRFAHPR